MEEFINNILIEPLNSPIILSLTIAYLVCESITTYSTRLIQFHTRDFHSGVALDAQGRMLPDWVGCFVFLGWGFVYFNCCTELEVRNCIICNQVHSKSHTYS